MKSYVDKKSFFTQILTYPALVVLVHLHLSAGDLESRLSKKLCITTFS